MPTEDTLIVAVDLDWCSTGLWQYSPANDLWVNLSYESMEVPAWLVARFDFWTSWMNRKAPVSFKMGEEESDLFAAYGLSLALDLRRHLTETFHEPIEVRFGRQREVHLPADADGRFEAKRQPRTVPRPMLAQLIPKSDSLKRSGELGL